MTRPNLLASARGRRVLFASYYALEGAPIGLLWWALPSLLAAEGLALERVTRLLALLVLPWTLKALWAPWLDLRAAAGGDARRWIAGAQLLMGATIGTAAFLEPRESYALLVCLLVAHAAAAATQDAAIDALAIRNAPEPERGSLNGWMQAGMLLSRSAFGGGLLLLAEPLGRRGLMLVLALFLCAGTALAFVWKEPARAPAPAGVRARELGAALRAALLRRSTWLVLLLALSVGAGFEAAGALAGPWLAARAGEPGLVPPEAARLFGLIAPAAMLLGALAGGRASDRLGRRAALAWAGLSLALACLVLAARAEQAGEAERALLLAAVYLGAGGVTATSYALFMSRTDPRLGATQFSAAMGATNVCEAWSVAAAGELAARRGFGWAFALPALVGLAALLLLLPLGARAAQGARERPAKDPTPNPPG